MTYAEFKKQAKELAVLNGVAKKDISIKADRWLLISINCEVEIFRKLKAGLEKLAGFKDNSDVMTDYFDYSVDLSDRCFGGMIISMM